MRQKRHIFSLRLRNKHSVKWIIVSRGILCPSNRLQSMDMSLPHIQWKETSVLAKPRQFFAGKSNVFRV